MRKINPRIVYGSISGFGQDGPYHKRPGFDQIAQGMGWFMSITLQRAGVAHPTGHSHTTRGCSACERRRRGPEATGAVIVADLKTRQRAFTDVVQLPTRSLSQS
jgi:CoA-transferase family III